MKIHNRSGLNGFIILGSALLAAAPAFRASAADLSTYLHLDSGVNFKQDLTVQGPVADTGGAKISFDTGYRVDLAYGVNLCKSFAVELEVGLADNSIHDINLTALGVTATGISGDEWDAPLMLNGIFNLPLGGSKFTAYIGGGAGGVLSGVSVDAPLANFNSTDFTFAYQGMAGIKYSFTPHLDLGVGYKFLGTLDHNWNDTVQGVADSLKTDGSMNHTIMATLNWNF